MVKRSHPAHRMSQYGPDKQDQPRDNSEAQKRTDQWLAELGLESTYEKAGPDSMGAKVGFLNGLFIGFD